MVGATVVVGVEQLLMTGVRVGLGRHQAHGRVVDTLFVPMLAGFDLPAPLLRQAGRALRLDYLFWRHYVVPMALVIRSMERLTAGRLGAGEAGRL